MRGVSYRRRMAESSCHGMFVAPRTRTPDVSFPTPSIWTSISVFILLLASLSPSPRVPQRASTSSMKMIDGLFSRAIVKSCFTSLHRYISTRPPARPSATQWVPDAGEN